MDLILNEGIDATLREGFARMLKGQSAPFEPVSYKATRPSGDKPFYVEIVRSDADLCVNEGWLETAQGQSHLLQMTAKAAYALRERCGYKPQRLDHLVREVLSYDFFQPSDLLEGRTAIPYVFDAGEPDSLLAIVVGENCSGKSFFRKLLTQVLRSDSEKPVQTIHLSQAGRTTQYAALVYGDESDSSTGSISSHVLIGGVSNACARRVPTLLYYDEPDIGLSEGSAKAAGAYLHRQLQGALQTDAPMLEGVFVTSHSRAFLQELWYRGGVKKPHYIFLGSSDGPACLWDWFVDGSGKGHEPEELMRLGHQRRKDIRKLLQGSKEP